MKKFINKKFSWVVTGGAGFIGSNLIKHLLKNNQKVICIDNLSTGKKDNIIEFLRNKNFKFVKHDIRNKFKYKIKCNFFVHLAALGSVPKSFKYPIETNDVNVSGSLNMYELSIKSGAKKFIFASSSSVYGNSKNKIKKENDPLNPISPYGLSKYIFEKYLNQIDSLNNIQCYGLRFFNVFGPYQNEFGPYAPVISKWIRNGLNKKKLELYGDGKAIRDFTYVDNVVSAIINLCLINKKSTNLKLFNIGTANPINLEKVYQKIKKILMKYNIRIKMVKKKPRNGDIKISSSDISLAKSYFKFEPIVLFDEGLTKYIEYIMLNEKK